MVIRQGDVYWVDFGPASGSGPAPRHPHVVVQNDVFNASAIATTVVCSLTSSLKWAKAPGNVLLDAGEANLPKASVVNISQISTVDKSELTERIGTLAAERLYQVLEGLSLLLEPRWITDPK
ncbi:MAG: type II toxin-antitoxin system PemK/MazF family toxin [Acidobacteriota bacterium]